MALWRASALSIRCLAPFRGLIRAFALLLCALFLLERRLVRLCELAAQRVVLAGQSFDLELFFLEGLCRDFKDAPKLLILAAQPLVLGKEIRTRLKPKMGAGVFAGAVLRALPYWLDFGFLRPLATSFAGGSLS